MESVRLQKHSTDLRRDLSWPCIPGVARLLTVCAVMFAGVPAATVQAAVLQLVQSGTTTSSATGITTVTLGTAVDTTKSFLVFQTRSSAAVPGGATVRGRLQTSTTLQFERATNETSTITIQWYVATFGTGVFVQRGEVTQSSTAVDVPITSVGTMAQAFVLFSKTPVSTDPEWSNDDAVNADLTSATNLRIRSSLLNAGHRIAWQVIQYTNAADITVQRGLITTMGAGTPSVTATIAAVNVRKTLVLASWRTADTGADIGARMLQAQLTNSTTITIDRSNSVPAIAEISWQAIEFKDASTVWTGSATFANGSAQTTAVLGGPDVNVSRAVGFISGQGGNGQSMGRSAYVTTDVPGVASATTSLAFNQLTLDRSSTLAAADVAWFVVQFDGGSPFKVGSFTKSLTTGTQTIAHGLGQVPKALILWTEGRTNETFSSPSAITFRAAAQAGTVAAAGTITQDENLSVDVTTAATTITTGAAVTTTSGNQLLLALVAGGRSTTPAGLTVTGVTGGGLTWQLVSRTNTQRGTAEIWRAFAPTTLTNATVTATFSSSVTSTMTVQSFSGVDTSGTNGSGAIGATATASAGTGAPSAPLTTTRDGSRVVGVGNDPTNDVARTAGAGQTVLHSLLVPSTVNATYWTQNRSAAIATSGSTGTINDTAPTVDAYNLSAAEILATPLTLTIAKPTGTVQNDVMIASITVRPNTTIVITPPAGWTLIRRVDNTPVPFPNSLAVYYKVAGAAEPANYSWTFNTGNGQAGGIISFAGVDTTNPVDIDLGQNTPVGFSHSAPSVTTTTSNDMIVTSHVFASADTWTPPAGMTEAVDIASVAPPANPIGQALEMNYVLQPVIGASGVRTATTTTSVAGNEDAGNGHTLALRPATPAYFGFGMTDGTTSKALSASSQNYAETTNTASRVADKVLTIVKWDTATAGVVLGEADFQSWDSTNLVLNWTTNDAYPYVVHYLAVGGTDLSAQVINWTTGTTIGNRVVTGLGFKPNLVFHAHGGFGQTAAPPSTSAGSAFGLGVMDSDGDQWANGFFALDAVGTSDSQRGQRTDSVIYAFDQSQVVQKQASWVSMDANGFTVNFSNATSTNDAQVFSLALAGLNAAVGSFNKSVATAPASQAITGTGFKPAAVLFSSVQDVTQATPVAHTRYGIGASDGTTEGSSAFQDENAAAVANVAGIDKTSKVFVKVDNTTPAIDAEADFSTNDADGFTVNWTANDAVATEILYVALGPMAVTEVRLTSFEAAKYDGGVLLQWKTGYEVDNLGFNLYRETEIAGVRTKVKVNASLIAGSGLQAGQGGIVTAERTYARWDRDPDALDPAVAYFLEDVDFNGTSKWNGPYYPIVSVLEEPSTLDSDEIADLNAAATEARRIFFSYSDDPAQTGPRASAPPAPPEVTTQWALAGVAGTFKIGIRKPGWYRVRQTELAGLPSNVVSTTLQLFADGTEQAIRVLDVNDDGIFDPADAIEFFGTGIDTPHTDTRTYWLRAGTQAGQRIVLDAGGSSSPSPLIGFSSMVRRKDRSVYAATVKNGDAENWFGSIVCPQSTAPVGECDDPWIAADVTITPNHIDRSAAGMAQLTVALQGMTSTSEGNANHQVSVLLNGSVIGNMDGFAGGTRAEQRFPVPVDLLQDGENTVALRAHGGPADISLVDAIRLDYPHAYTADADRLRFTVTGPASITVGGFASASIRVFDITERMAPIELPPTIGVAGGLSTVTVNVPGTGSRTLMAFSEETVASAEFVRQNTPSTLHATSNTDDYVIISHSGFIAQVTPLATHREGQGYHTAVVDVEDIYDEFSFGEKTPLAIKDFLRWARNNWDTAPRFVVLAGDATIDPRDYEGLGNADFVPTKLVELNGIPLETASDDWFADYDDDGLLEASIGRLPFRDAAQAASMVTKIIDYDSGAGQSWTKEVLLIADEHDGTTNFDQSIHDLSALLPPAYHATPVSVGSLGDDVAKQSIMTGVNSGKLIVNYSGHGGVDMWGQRGQLLNNADVANTWTNVGKLPFVVAMNCLNGLFQGIFGEESLAEAMMRKPGGGAVAAWASSGLTPPATQLVVNNELFRLIFNGTYSTLGEAVAAAKLVVPNQDLRRSWIFFGDPAMRLLDVLQPTPGTTIAPVISIHPQGATVPAGETRMLSVVATSTAPLTYQWYRGLSGLTTSPVAGATSINFTTPPVTGTTSYWVRVSNPYGHDDSDAAVLSTSFTIMTADPWPPVTAGDAYALTLTATDSTPPYQWQGTGLPSGLTLNSATGRVTGTPTAAGIFHIAIHVTDGAAASADQTFSLTVGAATDGLGAQQWYLKAPNVEPAGANVEAAWPLTLGAGIVIGIVDDGLEGTHPDLQGNYMPALSYDFLDHDDDAAPVTAGTCFDTANCEGTAAAGVVAARGDNSIGGSGVAPMASLAGIRLGPAPDDADEAAAFAHQLNAVDILNSSRRRTDNGRSLVAPGPRAEAALLTAVTDGRAGAGRIFVWGAGDGRAVNDNCNFDGYANSRFGIAVGAVDETSRQAWYSEPCSALLVSAPSSGGNRSLMTTDLAGAPGDDRGDYMAAFGGTSGAAPIVSGVVALMLARNPGLTWRDVQHILVRTSRKVDAGDPSWSAGAFPHSEKYGFGVVNAQAAVTLAATWTKVAAETAIPEVASAVGLAIPDKNRLGVSNTIAIGAQYSGFSIEHVEVEFNAVHPRRGDLEVTLTSPSGVVSHLGTVRPGDAEANFSNWRFRSVRHWGESPAGAWKLNVVDLASGNTGTFSGWTLRIYGTGKTARRRGDYDGDGKADVAVFKPSSGTWSIEYSGTGTHSEILWGNGLDVPVPADYDGDGRTDIAVFRPSNGTWYIVHSLTGATVGVQWGNGQDVPVPADYDGDGKTDIAVFRPSDGTWYIVYSSTGATVGVQWGNGADRPVPGDYDGDGKTDIAVFRPSNGIWYIIHSRTRTVAGVQWGNAQDVVVPGDYDGDGKTDIAVFRPSNGTWYIVNSRTQTTFGKQWGNGQDVAVPADYDGDGKTDIAVFRPSNGVWYIVHSGTGTTVGVQWGTNADIPLVRRP